MREGRPPTIWPVVLQALQDCTDPLGATHAHLVQVTGLQGHRTVSGALLKLTRRGLAFAILGGHASRYFATEAARQAARPTLDAIRGGRDMPMQRTSRIRNAIRQALAECTEAFGLNHKQLIERTGLSSKSITCAVMGLRQNGEVCALGKNRDTRYLPSREARDAVKAAFDAHMVQVAAQRIERAREVARVRARDLYYNDPAERERCKRWSKYQANRKTAGKVQLVLAPAKTATLDPAKKKWRDQEPIVPPTVKVQRLPGCPQRTRYEPPPWFKGEFTREFEILTAT